MDKIDGSSIASPWPADEVGLQQRPGNYTKIDDPFQVYAPQTFVCFFGMNESFSGRDRKTVETFKQQYRVYLDRLSERLSTPDRPVDVILVTPVAFESTGNPLQPLGKRENENLAAYAKAVREIGQERKRVVADFFDETKTLYEAQAGAQYTTDGLHLNERGNAAIASTRLSYVERLVCLWWPEELVQGKITNRADKRYRNRTKNLTIWVSDEKEAVKIGIKGPGILNVDRTVFYGPAR